MPTRTPSQPPAAVQVFTQRFSSTPLGARLARHLALHQLDAWGIPYASPVAERVEVLVAELAANAVTHGRVPGRDFEMRLTATHALLRVEVSDAKGERRPCPSGSPAGSAPPSERPETGRGLLLVDALADRWRVLDRLPVGKTVRAEIDLTPCSARGAEKRGD